MKSEKLTLQNDPGDRRAKDDELTQVDKQIVVFRERVKRQEERGRLGGTYDHARLDQLEKIREDLTNG